MGNKDDDGGKRRAYLTTVEKVADCAKLQKDTIRLYSRTSLNHIYIYIYLWEAEFQVIRMFHIKIIYLSLDYA